MMTETRKDGAVETDCRMANRINVDALRNDIRVSLVTDLQIADFIRQFAITISEGPPSALSAAFARLFRT
jgi:hypothetical protein